MDSFKDAAYRVLKKARKPLHSKRITEMALKQGWLKTTGKTPDVTMSALLTTDINAKGNKSRFIKTAPNVFGLNKTINKKTNHTLKRSIEKSKKKNDKGILLKGILERVSSDAFEIVKKELKDMIKDSSGIYALYKDEKLYYVGLAKHLSARLLNHLERDRHAGKWNKFSVFFVKRTNYLKDLETLVLRISKPKGNKLKGKIPHHYELKDKLKNIVREIRNKADKLATAL